MSASSHPRDDRTSVDTRPRVTMPRLSRAETVRVTVGATAGTVLEWYDYFLFGTLAALVFNKLFFPDVSPMTGILLSLSTFSVGFLGRPLGGIVFGHIGDRHGRLVAFRISLVLAGVATLAMGLLPTYASVGLLAPTLLVILRFVQGVGLGGEYGGATIVMAESADIRRRGFVASWAQWAAPAGQLLGLGAVGLLSSGLSDTAFRQWGWRIPFLVSAVLVALGYYLRLRMVETERLRRYLSVTNRERSPLRQVVTDHRRALLITIGSRMSSDVTIYVVSVFSLAYLTTTLGVPSGVALSSVIVGNALQMIVIPLAAALGDKIGRRPVYVLGAAAAGAWGFAFFPLLGTRGTVPIMIAICGGLVAQAIVSSGHAAFHVERFTTNVRYSGVSVGYQLGGVIGGGIAPTVAFGLFAAFGSWVPVAVYLAVAAVATIVAAVVAEERNRASLDEIPTEGHR